MTPSVLSRGYHFSRRYSPNRRDSQFHHFHIFFLRQSAYGYRTDHLAVLLHRHAAAPSDIPGIAIVRDFVTLFGIARLLPDFEAGLAGACRRERFVGGDDDRGNRSAVHASQRDQFAA